MSSFRKYVWIAENLYFSVSVSGAEFNGLDSKLG